MEAGYHEIVAVYENALVNSVEAKDDLLTVRLSNCIGNAVCKPLY